MRTSTRSRSPETGPVSSRVRAAAPRSRPRPAPTLALAAALLPGFAGRSAAREATELLRRDVDGLTACAFDPTGADGPDRTLCELEDPRRDRLRRKSARTGS